MYLQLVGYYCQVYHKESLLSYDAYVHVFLMYQNMAIRGLLNKRRVCVLMLFINLPCAILFSKTIFTAVIQGSEMSAVSRLDTLYTHTPERAGMSRNATGLTRELPPFYLYRNCTKVDSNLQPCDLYYQRQSQQVNSWTYPVLYHNASLCGVTSEQDLFLFALIFTSPSNTQARDDVRMTWGGEMKQLGGIRMSFVLGKPRDAHNLTLLFNEARIYTDIIIFDFYDDYELLTIKSMLLLNWANRFCSKVQFVLKIDDDMVINLRALTSNLKRHVAYEHHHVIGHNVGHRRVHRSGQWRLPTDQYPYDLSPPYLVGPFYVMTSHAVSRLLDASHYVPLVRLEDVYVTGIVRDMAGLNLTEDRAWFSYWTVENGAYQRLVDGQIVGLHHKLSSSMRSKLQQDIIAHNKSKYV